KMVEMGKRAGGGMSFDTKKDMVMGHEFCAEILEHGPGTSKILKEGTRVCSIPVAFSLEKGVTPIGYSNDLPGGYAERMALSEMLLIEVPNGLSTELAATTEPMAVGEHAVVKANLDGEEVPIVIGCGPVGLAVIAGLKRRGVGPIIAADFSPTRRKMAEAMGADIIVNPADTSPYEAWSDEASPEGYDPANPMTLMGIGPQQKPCVVFECVGVPGIIQQILEGAARNARVVVVGVCMEIDHLEPMFAINKELNIQFVLGYAPDEFAGTLQHIADGAIDVEPMLTGKVGVTGVAQAFKDLGNPEEHAKILVEPWRE
ncbi:MAG: zinc-binding dehydrogenase, partial [Alphaproteobacteria bacterium]